MNTSFDDRARGAADALRTAAELRPTPVSAGRTRAPIRVLVTAALLVIVVVVGAFLALREASPRNGGAASQPRGKSEARAFLLTGGHTDGSSLGQSALLLRIGVVPARVVQQLHSASSPLQLADQIHISTDAKQGRITITSDQPTAKRAIVVVNTFAEQLVSYDAQLAKTTYRAAVEDALARAAQLSQSLRNVESQLRIHPNDANLVAQKEGLETAFSTASKSYAQVVSTGVPGSTLHVIEASAATPLRSPSQSTSHRSLAVALGVLAVLLLGTAAGFGLGRRRTPPAT
jgi:uncharacterized protein with PIN domain